MSQESRAAESAASSDASLYQEALRKYGRPLATYRGHIPRSLSVAHVLRVNRNLEDDPSFIGQNTKRGFMHASTSVGRDSGFEIGDMDRPSLCAYIWGKEFNRLARSLYVGHTSYFPESGPDFWKTVYLRNAMGDSTFDKLWGSVTSLDATGVYEKLVGLVTALNSSIPPWSVTQLKKTVLVDCAYVFALARKNGGLSSEGYGKTPTMKKEEIL